MIKGIYISAWIAVGLATVALLWTGSFHAAALVAISLIVVALVYSFALWSVLTNTRDTRLGIYRGDDRMKPKGAK